MLDKMEAAEKWAQENPEVCRPLQPRAIVNQLSKHVRPRPSGSSCGDEGRQVGR